MKFSCYVLSEEVFKEAFNLLTEEEKKHIDKIIYESSAIVIFASYSEKLLFEAAMMKGYLATRIEIL